MYKFKLEMCLRVLILSIGLIAFVSCKSKIDEQGVFANTESHNISNGDDLQSGELSASGYLTDSPATSWCSAQVIGPKVVLTAAHCCQMFFNKVPGKKIFNTNLKSGSKSYFTKSEKGVYTDGFDDQWQDTSYILLKEIFAVKDDVCLFELEEQFAENAFTVNFNFSPKTDNKYLILGSGLTSPSDPVKLPRGRQKGYMDFEMFSSEAVRLYGRHQSTLGGDSGGGLYQIESITNKLSLIAVSSTAVRAACWRMPNNGLGYGAFFKDLGNGFMIAKTPPGGPEASCILDSTFDGVVEDGEIYIPPYRSAFASLSSPNFRLLAEAFVKQRNLEICGLNLNCESIFY